ncbi:GNAT family N-acetyltransferase [Paenibacillus paeoniae]|nr:GNAT family N-acetyltransferase [Paenibacillus paeoniae]
MTIIPLNPIYLDQASRLVNDVFGDEEEELYPAQELWASLDKKHLKKYQTSVDAALRSFQYYIAVEDREVCGIIGLYEMQEDFEQQDWVGWYCVDERYRGRRIGIQLLNYVIEASKKRGKQRLCLYTSTHESERKAQTLYDQNEFYVTKTVNKGSYQLLYRQKNL